jgi:hypothetical protein
VAAKKIPADVGLTAVRAASDGDETMVPTAVRYLLQALAERMPGNSVEVRVPPYGATQCVAGPGHTRGTPPNLVELDPSTFIQLATGELGWSSLKSRVGITVSGVRADEVANGFPLMRLN